LVSWLATIFSSTEAAPDTSWMWVRVLAFLGVLASCAYFITYYNRKKQFRAFSENKGKIIIADTCPLGNRQYLVVAQYGNEKHLIGVHPTAISHLSKLEESESSGIAPLSSKNENIS
jgi:flagellar biogenesis protein FliO